MRESEYMNVSTLQFLRAARSMLGRASDYGLLTGPEREAIKTIAEAEVRMEKLVDADVVDE